MEPSLSSVLDFARQIAEEAGQLLMQGRSQLQSADVETKSSARDLVTQVDRDCESFLVSKIQ
ncbi:MAG: inositol monophosphatase family protein, partial [Planctomycetota bacterium]|nr:inositol monophosphatase family protein [Planctomycetota bacterium]